jgi:hypothetical protein
MGKKFNRCVKSVRKTVKARKGSTKESAAIAICTTTVLHPRGRTLKRYRKGRLVTQKKRKMRGGDAKSIVDTILQKFDEAGATGTMTDTEYEVNVNVPKTPENDASIDALIKKLTDVKASASFTGRLSGMLNAAKQRLAPATGGAVTEDIVAKLQTLKDMGSVTFEGEWDAMDNYRGKLEKVRGML